MALQTSFSGRSKPDLPDPGQMDWLEHYKLHREVPVPGSRRRPGDCWKRGAMIGRGGSSVVFVETNEVTDKVRAVKEIGQNSRQQCLEAELLALTRLSRPAYEAYFVQFQGWYSNQWSLSLAMEYFHLGDLEKHMQAPIVETDAREIAFQLFSGLQVMHKDGFAHRDLKPSNIFVVKKAPRWHVKIGDFGVSKRIPNEMASMRSEVGTKEYMAPEVIGVLPNNYSSTAYDNKVDSWAAGIILYEMMSGRLPFQDLGVLSEFCHERLNFPGAPLRQQRVSLPGRRLVKRLLKALPSDRPDSNTALASEWFSTDNDELLGDFSTFSRDMASATTENKPEQKQDGAKSPLSPSWWAEVFDKPRVFVQQQSVKVAQSDAINKAMDATKRNVTSTIHNTHRTLSSEVKKISRTMSKDGSVEDFEPQS